MRLFEETKQEQDAAALILATLREFREVPVGSLSKKISPSGLACQVACAFKLQGVQPEPELESFQSRCFTDCGEDRHQRIQAFLSTTPYWVDVAEYVEKMKLPLEVIRKDGFEVLLEHKELPIRFKCDGILFIEGVYYILEIKTERGTVNASRTIYDPKHQKQGITYALLLQTNNILWLYEGRELLQQKLFVQAVTQEEKKELRLYLNQIVENVDRVENLQKDPKSCGYCSYKKHCKAYFKALAKEQKQNVE